MGRWGAVLLAILLLAGCTRVVSDARPQKERPVGPIVAGQVEDLVSENARGGDAGSSLYAKVEPAECAGLAQEVHAPLIFGARPVAHTGGIYYDDKTQPPGNVVEIVGVYHSDFDPAAATQAAGNAIEACRRDTLTASGIDDQDIDHFTVAPRSDSDSPQIVLWSLTDPGKWGCDNAFIAAHNAAIEITVCATANGYDVLSLGHAALNRIEALADMTK